MLKIKTLLFLAVMAALSACTTSSGVNLRSGSGATLSPTAQLYGDYLAASYASYLNDEHARSEYFSKAFARRPEDLKLGRKAMVAALSAGDNALARTLAIEIRGLDEQDGLARAILGAHALASSKYDQAIKYLGNANDGIGLEDINALMRGWGQAGQGEKDLALETFTQLEGGKYFELMGQLQKAKLYAQLGDGENANKFFKQIDDVGISTIESVLSQARFHIAQGATDKALARMEEFAADNGGALTGPIRKYITLIEAGKNIKTKMSAAQSASRALTEPAYSYYGKQKQYEAAEIFLRLALELDPKNDKARLFLGLILESEERGDAAMKTYSEIGPSSPYTVSARMAESNILFKKEENAKAIKKLENIYKLHPSKVTQSTLGRAFLVIEDYENALPFYEQLIADMSEEEKAANPQYHYLRGICLERLERWQEAVVDFEFVLKQQPENADALNYLGYTWVDKGVELEKAFKMIRKAVKLQPKSGAIIDSLGWAHYKLGQYSKARLKLEDAAERSPSSATIIDHLGDVYWKLGRIREAGYQWQRALTLDPTDKETKVIKAKLKSGLAAGQAAH